jgi:hypothetical protein
MDKAAEIIQAGWAVSNYTPPALPLAYEEATNAWFVVIEDHRSIVELADEEGRIYTVPKQRCYIEDFAYICPMIDPSQDMPLTWRQHFVTETIIPMLREEFILV